MLLTNPVDFMSTGFVPFRLGGYLTSCPDGCLLRPIGCVEHVWACVAVLAAVVQIPQGDVADRVACNAVARHLARHIRRELARWQCFRTGGNPDTRPRCAERPLVDGRQRRIEQRIAEMHHRLDLVLDCNRQEAHAVGGLRTLAVRDQHDLGLRTVPVDL